MTPPEALSAGNPGADADSATLTPIIGALDVLKSPVQTFSGMVYADIALAGGSRHSFALSMWSGPPMSSPARRGDRSDRNVATGELVVFEPGAELVLLARGATRLMLVGGEPLPSRHIYCFVSSRHDRIEQAKADWRADRFAHAGSTCSLLCGIDSDLLNPGIAGTSGDVIWTRWSSASALASYEVMSSTTEYHALP